MTTTPKAKNRQQIIGDMRVPTHQPPPHPGEMLLEEFLKPLGVSQEQLAEAVGVPCQEVSELILGQRSVTPSLALRLAKYLGMSATFWMNLQLCWDLYHVLQSEGEILNSIEPLTRPDLPEVLEKADLEETGSP